jgi:hypothetical protein
MIGEMDAENERSTSTPVTGLTLKRVLVCASIFGLVAFALNKYSTLRRDAVRMACLVRLGNLNEALVLYRADYDGISPNYDRSEVFKTDTKLTIYAGGKPISCPYESVLKPIKLRISRNGKVSYPPVPGARVFPLFTPFGVEDTSVVATCNSHLEESHSPHFNGFISHWYISQERIGGKINVLLRNGTAKSIPFDTPTHQWFTRLGNFVAAKDKPASWQSYSAVYLFDFEPTPPRFEH